MGALRPLCEVWNYVKLLCWLQHYQRSDPAVASHSFEASRNPFQRVRRSTHTAGSSVPPQYDQRISARDAQVLGLAWPSVCGPYRGLPKWPAGTFRKTEKIWLSFVWCGQGVRPDWSPRSQVWVYRRGGNVARCSLPADSVWTKRGCRERPWGQAGDNSQVFQCVKAARATSCPRLAPTHPPFAHTAPHSPRCGPGTPAAQQQLVF
jgi:hypothetical protein